MEQEKSLSDFLVEVVQLIAEYAAELVAFILGLFI